MPRNTFVRFSASLQNLPRSNPQNSNICGVYAGGVCQKLCDLEQHRIDRITHLLAVVATDHHASSLERVSPSLLQVSAETLGCLNRPTFGEGKKQNRQEKLSTTAKVLKLGVEFMLSTWTRFIFCSSCFGFGFWGAIRNRLSYSCCGGSEFIRAPELTRHAYPCTTAWIAVDSILQEYHGNLAAGKEHKHQATTVVHGGVEPSADYAKKKKRRVHTRLT